MRVESIERFQQGQTECVFSLLRFTFQTGGRLDTVISVRDTMFYDKAQLQKNAERR